MFIPMLISFSFPLHLEHNLNSLNGLWCTGWSGSFFFPTVSFSLGHYISAILISFAFPDDTKSFLIFRSLCLLFPLPEILFTPCWHLVLLTCHIPNESFSLSKLAFLYFPSSYQLQHDCFLNGFYNLRLLNFFLLSSSMMAAKLFFTPLCPQHSQNCGP